jgi:YVTN family beta-propeller protein
VSVIRTADFTLLQNIVVGDPPTAIAITPNGRYGYVVNFRDNTLSVIDCSNLSVITTLSNLSLNRPIDIAITPDGLNAYVTNEGNNTISVLNLSDPPSGTTLQRVLSSTDYALSKPTSIAIMPFIPRSFQNMRHR